MGCAWNVLQVLFSSRSLFPPNLKEKEGESRVSLKADQVMSFTRAPFISSGNLHCST